MEQEKKNILFLSVSQGLSISTTNINVINTGLVGTTLAIDPSYAALTLSLQFMTIAITLISVSLLMRKIGRRPMFLNGAMAAFIGCLIIAWSISYKFISLFVVGSILLGFSQATQQFYSYATADNFSKKTKK